ncbi:MAG TPA: tetratricopeptide repeat protein [Gemmatimonadaceae bacterium]|nr:tetratricopeptide repeat protein [Gemmatimonadaceae bacterium]
MATTGRIEELRKRYDENPRRFFAPLANEYRKAGDLEQAIALCQMHLADAPGNLSGQIVFGQALFEAGSLDESRSAFETAIGLDPENLIALRHLGDIGRLQNDIPRAKVWYQRVLDADRRNEDVLAIMEELSAAEPAPVPQPPPAPEPEPASEAAFGQADEPAPPREEPAGFETTSLAGNDIPITGTPTVQVDVIPPPAPMSISEPTPLTMPVVDDAVQADAEAPAHHETFPHEPAQAEETPVPEPAAENPAEYGMVAPASPISDEVEASTFTPDSSFGFDIDLGAAANIPLSSAPAEPSGDIELTMDVAAPEPEPTAEPAPAVPDSGLLDLDAIEPVDFDAVPSQGSMSPAEPADLPSSPAVPFDSGDVGLGSLEMIPSEFDQPPPQPRTTEVRRPTPAVLDGFDIVGSEPPADAAALEEASPAAEPPPVAFEPAFDEPPAEPESAFSLSNEAELVSTDIELSSEPESEPAEPEPAPAAAETAPAELEVSAPQPEPISSEPSAPEPEPVAAESAFATETMAEVYVQQGLRQEAIGVYRQLVASRPDDHALRARLANLEAGDAPAAAPSAEQPPPVASARSFFASLASRRGTPRSTPAVPEPRGSISGTVDQLFGRASVGMHDESSAKALSEAYGSGSTLAPGEKPLSDLFGGAAGPQ